MAGIKNEPPKPQGVYVLIPDKIKYRSFSEIIKECQGCDPLVPQGCEPRAAWVRSPEGDRNPENEMIHFIFGES